MISTPADIVIQQDFSRTCSASPHHLPPPTPIRLDRQCSQWKTIYYIRYLHILLIDWLECAVLMLRMKTKCPLKGWCSHFHILIACKHLIAVQKVALTKLWANPLKCFFCGRVSLFAVGPLASWGSSVFSYFYQVYIGSLQVLWLPAG